MADETAPLSAEELAQIRARAEAATPGLWFVLREQRGGGWIVDHEYENALFRTNQSSEQAKANAVFVAWAHEHDIPRLLATVEALREIAQATAAFPFDEML